MESYNYYEAIKDDIRDYLAENFTDEEIRENLRENRDEFEEELYDALFIEDSVTGNGSGSYTFSGSKANEYLGGNVDLMFEAYDEFGMPDERHRNAESADVTIRCYLLGSCLSEVLDDYDKSIIPMF